MFDPEKFGAAMGEAIQKAVAPLQKEIADLKKQLAEKPDFAQIIRAQVGEAVAALPVPKDGRDCDMEAIKAMVETAMGEVNFKFLVADEVRHWTEGIPLPKDGKDGKDGGPGSDGAPGQKGADGIGLAGAMIDRDGNLMATLSNGEVKNLGPVVGKDGKNGTDGIGFDSFDLEYIAETHEIAIKATAAGRSKELRYPAGGIRPAGYWREGTRAKAGEAWTHDGSLWIATKETSAKPENGCTDWVIGARRGRDGERGQKGLDGSPPAPIKLGS